jgi:hypothetical protein
MLTSSSSVYTTSDLRRAEVIDEAFVRPVAVRDGKTGGLLLMVPQEMIDQSNALEQYTQLFARVVVECQRADPSPVSLDRAGYIVDWSVAQRDQFVREFAEALSASITEGNTESVDAFITYMANAGQPIAGHFHSSFLDGELGLLEAHMSQP